MRAGRPPDLRWAGRDLKDRKATRPVALWTDDGGRTLILTAVANHEKDSVFVEVVIPPNLATVVNVTGGAVVATALDGIEIRGSDLKVDARALTGAADIEIERGSVQVTGSQSHVNVVARDATTAFRGIKGDLTVSQTGGGAVLTEIEGQCFLDFEGTRLEGEIFDGAVELTAQGGSASLLGLKKGGILSLEGTPAVLTTVSGATEVETDAKLEFREVSGTLKVHSYGGEIVGEVSKAELRVSGTGFSFRGDQLTGPTYVEGDDLQLSLTGSEADTVVNTRSSRIEVSTCKGKLSITNDFGDILVDKAAQEVEIASSDGNVSVVDLEGSIQLKANGPQTIVKWLSLSREIDSLISNPGGSVDVMFSSSSGGQIDAESKQGRIETSLDGLTVSGDGRTANGYVNRIARPRVQIVAGGDMRIGTFEPAAPAGN